MKKTAKTHPDLFKNERSVTGRLYILLTPEYHKASLQELKKRAIEILNLKDTVVSDKKRREIENIVLSKKTIFSLQSYIKNLVLAGSNMGLR